jgi:hypothetical protein
MKKPRGSVPFLLLLLVSLLFGADKPDRHAPILRLWFSPDGKYVLAQDTEEIIVLTVEPFAVRFRIPARDATLAQFTPDSSSLVFVRSATLASPDKIAVAHGTPHVERWSVSEGKLGTSMALPGSVCGTLVLAPDGRTYACDDYQGTVRVIDVASSETILEKKKFVRPIYSWVGNYRIDFPYDLGQASLSFSPDGRILVGIGAGGRQWGNSSALIWDVSERRPVTVKGLVHFIRDGAAFAFLDPNRVLISRGWSWRKGDAVRARIVTFPDGKPIAIVTIPLSGALRRAADPAFLIVGAPLVTQYMPFRYGTVPVKVPTDKTVAVELATGQTMVSEAGTLDVFGDRYVTEIRPGEIGIYERHNGIQSTVALH